MRTKWQQLATAGTAAAVMVAVLGCRTPSATFVGTNPASSARPVELSELDERSSTSRSAADDVFVAKQQVEIPQTVKQESFEWASTAKEIDSPAIQLTAAALSDATAADETAAFSQTSQNTPEITDGSPEVALPTLPSIDNLEPDTAPTEQSDVSPSGLTLEQVISSVYSTYPLLQASITQRQRAAGNQLATWGAFDRNLKASTENQPVGFYETYRHKFGVSRNIYKNGGDWFAQYQLGRGNFEPWYREREKNEGGEFSAGFTKPLLQGRDIDARRAAIWRATFERQRVEPAIRKDLIMFVLDASASYWNWVAAGQRYRLAETLLDVAEERNRQLTRQVEEGAKERPLLPENRRLVLNRQGALLDAGRKLQQASATLSLFYRDGVGTPLIVDDSELPTSFNRFDFNIDNTPDVMADLSTAIASRPELFELEAQRRKLNVTLAEAENTLLPSLDIYSVGRQNVGGRTSSKNDKQPFQFETGLRFDVPIERSQARGKISAAQAEMARLSAQTKFAEEKILAELQVAAAMLEAASGRVAFAAESIELAEELLVIEKKRFREGLASLLELTIREQQFAESTEALIAARFDLNIARAAYRAALGIDRLPDQAQ